MNSKTGGNAVTILKRIGFTVLLPVVLYLILCVLRPQTFLNGSTLIMMFTQTIPSILIGWSLLFGLSVGLFDFSVGSRIILSGMVGMYLSQIYGLPGFLIGCYVTALLLALITGLVYSVLKIPSIITGFAVLLIFEAIAALVRTGMRSYLEPAHLFLGKVPYIYVAIVVLFIVVFVIYNNTKFGYQIKAIGGNELVAKSMGINVGKLKLLTYVIGGSILGAATIVYISYMGIVNNETNMMSISMAFTPMMGVLLGMLIKSCNPVIGSIVGAMSISIVSTGMVALGLESYLLNVVIGIFIVSFMAFQLNSGKLKQLFRRRMEIGTKEGSLQSFQ